MAIPIRKVAAVNIFDESHGVFGELIDPAIVLEGVATATSELVGKLDDPERARSVTAVHSLSCSSSSSSAAVPQIVVEFENWANHAVIVRWMDEHGRNNPDTHKWTIEPQSQFIQYTKPGHLFVVSILIENEESLLGAYRVINALPSNNTHCILIDEEVQEDAGEHAQSCFVLEAILTDATKRDAFVVTAAALEGGFKHSATLSNLSTLVQNILKQPDDTKYHTLKTDNHAVCNHLLSCPAAVQMLSLLGFGQIQDSVLLQVHHPILDRFYIAAELLTLLTQRAAASCAELAPPAPWLAPEFGNAHFVSHSGSTHFISPEERWARVERWHSLRGSGRARRPEPGEAPSSRGTWGR